MYHSGTMRSFAASWRIPTSSLVKAQHINCRDAQSAEVAASNRTVCPTKDFFMDNKIELVCPPSDDYSLRREGLNDGG